MWPLIISLVSLGDICRSESTNNNRPKKRNLSFYSKFTDVEYTQIIHRGESDQCFRLVVGNISATHNVLAHANHHDGTPSHHSHPRCNLHAMGTYRLIKTLPGHYFHTHSIIPFPRQHHSLEPINYKVYT